MVWGASTHTQRSVLNQGLGVITRLTSCDGRPVALYCVIIVCVLSIASLVSDTRRLAVAANEFSSSVRFFRGSADASMTANPASNLAASDDAAVNRLVMQQSIQYINMTHLIHYKAQQIASTTAKW